VERFAGKPVAEGPARHAEEEAPMMGGMAMWSLAGVMLLVMAVLGVLWVVQHVRDRRGPDRGEATPEEILRRRYAAGEIDEEEYGRRRGELDRR
jgi:putative membrane protein